MIFLLNLTFPFSLKKISRSCLTILIRYRIQCLLVQYSMSSRKMVQLIIWEIKRDLIKLGQITQSIRRDNQKYIFVKKTYSKFYRSILIWIENMFVLSRRDDLNKIYFFVISLKNDLCRVAKDWETSRNLKISIYIYIYIYIYSRYGVMTVFFFLKFERNDILNTEREK